MDTTDLFNQNPPMDIFSQVPQPIKAEIILTPEQQVVEDGLLQNWLLAAGKNPVLFTGYAGTGKTTTLGVLIKKIVAMGLNVGMSAPTHKAVKVMRRNALPGVEYRTIHSWLQLKPQKNQFTGETTFVPDTFPKEPPPITSLDVLILDETSMLTDDVFNYLAPYVKKGLKMLFTGDRAQIPPVKHVDCIPFRNAISWNLLEYSLEKIQRQAANNPILQFATEIRNDYKSGSFEPHTQLLEDGSGIKVIDHASEEEKAILAEFFTSPKFQEDPDYMKLIAWRNKTCSEYNEIIRHLIYPNQPNLEGIVVGEKLIMNEPWKITNRLMLTVNEEITVEDISYKQEDIGYHDGWGHNDYLSIKLYMAEVSWYVNEKKQRTTIPIVHEQSMLPWKQLIQKMAKMAKEIDQSRRSMMWKQFFAHENKFADVGYNYAVTAHTSQGSTYDQALVLKWDIDVNGTFGKSAAEKVQKIEERNRILYVAVTRPRKTLFIEP